MVTIKIQVQPPGKGICKYSLLSKKMATNWPPPPPPPNPAIFTVVSQYFESGRALTMMMNVCENRSRPRFSLLRHVNCIMQSHAVQCNLWETIAMLKRSPPPIVHVVILDLKKNTRLLVQFLNFLGSTWWMCLFLSFLVYTSVRYHGYPSATFCNENKRPCLFNRKISTGNLFPYSCTSIHSNSDVMYTWYTVVPVFYNPLF